MSANAGRVASRRNAARAAEQGRRQKLLLGLGGGLLVVVLAIQGPKLLKLLNGSRSASATPAASSTAAGSNSTPGAATAAVPGVPSAASVSRELKRVNSLGNKDPFVPQIVAAGGGAAAVTTSIAGPSVRMSHFVPKDPFIQQLNAGPAAPAAAPAAASSAQSFPAATKTASKAKTGSAATTTSGLTGYIVVLASVPVAAGRADANTSAAHARHLGLDKVGVLVSAKYPGLRTGFLVVFTGTYPKLATALDELGQARNHGYASAYTRRLGGS